MPTASRSGCASTAPSAWRRCWTRPCPSSPIDVGRELHRDHYPTKATETPGDAASGTPFQKRYEGLPGEGGRPSDTKQPSRLAVPRIRKATCCGSSPSTARSSNLGARHLLSWFREESFILPVFAVRS
jgi:hypothetical protein